MGHIIFILLHLVAVFFGFILLVITIPLHMIYAAATRPKGNRPDGKPKTRGWIGPTVDAAAIKYKMKDCPYCKQKVHKQATKCPHCQEWLPEENKQKDDQEDIDRQIIEWYK